MASLPVSISVSAIAADVDDEDTARESATGGTDTSHEWHPSPFFGEILHEQALFREEEPDEYERVSSCKTGRVHAYEGHALLTVRGRVYVPERATHIIRGIVDRLHNAAAYHLSAENASKVLEASRYFIPDFHRHFATHTAECSCRARIMGVDGAPRAGMRPARRFAPRSAVFMDWFKMPSDGGGDRFRWVCITTCAASRVVNLFAIPGTPTASDSVLALREWAAVYNYPTLVISDSASHFRGEFADFLEERHITARLGTPYNSRGRGIVERIVGTLKSAFSRLLEHGKTGDWALYLSAVQHAYNSAPHSALAHFSPFEVLFGESVTHELPPLGLDGLPDFPSDHPPSPAAFAQVRDSIRQLADMCGEVQSFVRASTSAHLAVQEFAVGSFCMVYAPSRREHKLQSPYIGPCIVVSRGEDSSGKPTGFYECRECLAGYTSARPLLDTRPFFRHANHLRPFHLGDREVNDVLAQQLEHGFFFVTDILDGPDEYGNYYVVFDSGHKQWLPEKELSKTTLLRNFKERLRQQARADSRDRRARPSVTPSGGAGASTPATASSSSATATASLSSAAATASGTVGTGKSTSRATAAAAAAAASFPPSGVATGGR